MTIQTYFSGIKRTADEYTAADFVSETHMNFETRSGGQGYLKGRIVFADGSELHFSEYLDRKGNTVEKLMPTYHYQNADREMIFRYDNSQHRPLLPYPDHKHTPDQVVCTLAPTLEDVLYEIAAGKRWGL
jgi:hypothetical protein